MRETYELPTVTPLPIAARLKRRCQTRRQQNPTEIDTMQQSPTNCNESSCPPARARQRRCVSFLSAWRLRPARSGFDVLLGVAVPSPSCQYIERKDIP